MIACVNEEETSKDWLWQQTRRGCRAVRVSSLVYWHCHHRPLLLVITDSISTAAVSPSLYAFTFFVFTCRSSAPFALFSQSSTGKCTFYTLLVQLLANTRNTRLSFSFSFCECCSALVCTCEHCGNKKWLSHYLFLLISDHRRHTAWQQLTDALFKNFFCDILVCVSIIFWRCICVAQNQITHQFSLNGKLVSCWYGVFFVQMHIKMADMH